ncbi:SCO family protein [Aeromonas bivalvium]|uniref:SCO family protein n=1 Tax=Aeromonas bivalvium TaxID=440079 RepID=UPI0005A9A96E|nr:SCO family protein [Aeromonas bivalvium]
MAKWRFPLLLLVFIAGVSSAWFIHKPEEPEQATYYAVGRDLGPFSLVDADGQPFTPANLKGHWSFLFVGYTFCPDVCPTTLADLRSVYPELRKLDARSQVVFISADPQRDTPERLKSYVAFFQPDFKAATAPHGALFPFVRNLGLIYSIAEQGEKDYLIDHSASIVLVNPEGQLQAIFRPESVPGQVPHVAMKALVSDFDRILTLSGS